MAARLDSYQKAYSEAGQVPTEQDLTEILNDFKAVQELQAKHSSSLVANFLKARSAPIQRDPTPGLLEGSAHLSRQPNGGPLVNLVRAPTVSFCPATIPNRAVRLPDRSEIRSRTYFKRSWRRFGTSVASVLVTGGPEIPRQRSIYCARGARFPPLSWKGLIANRAKNLAEPSPTRRVEQPSFAGRPPRLSSYRPIAVACQLPGMG